VTLVRVKLYELLSTLIAIDNQIINGAIMGRNFMQIIVEDYLKNDKNPAIL